MRLKDLEAALQPLKGFENPKLELEQYVTSAHIAAHMLFTAENSFGDIEDRTILDLGCGCGALSIAANICGAGFVLGVDIDPHALDVAQQNISTSDTEDFIELLQADILGSGQNEIVKQLEGKFDTVLMNPPFGTKLEGADMGFLEMGCKIATNSVYSLHKTSTRAYILQRAKTFGFQGRVIAELRYDLPKTYKMHKKKSLDIQVDFWRFSRI